MTILRGYLLLFDPLDGSSNIDINIAVGTIFSVLRAPDDGREITEAILPTTGSRSGDAC